MHSASCLFTNNLLTVLGFRTRLGYKRRSKMSFKMVALTRCKQSGAYIARKGIPGDVRDAYEKLHGSRWEAKFYARGNVPLHEVKRRFSEWQAELSSRIDALRRMARGEGRGLTHREAHALAGEWYAWFGGLQEANPGSVEKWSELALEVVHSRLGVASPNAGPRSKREIERRPPPDLRSWLIGVADIAGQ